MTALVDRIFKRPPQKTDLLVPGIYHYQAPPDAAVPYRLHLRVEPDHTAVLVVNAATVVHLNASAAAHALLLIRGLSEQEAAAEIASRYRVSRRRALDDHELLREQVVTLATTPELDPVLSLGLDRQDPSAVRPSAPYRLDLALTYRIGEGDATDPLARRRVDRELTAEEWKTVLTCAWQVGIPHVTFTGGEPTLRPDLVELIQAAEAQGQVTGLLTDGCRLASGDLLDRLSQAGLDHLLIAVSDDPASLDGLKRAIASDIYTVAHWTLTPENAADPDARLKAFREMGVSAVSLSASQASEAMTAAVSQARNRVARLGMDLVWDLPAPYSASNPINLELEAPSTGAGRAFLYVEPDGDVLPGQGIDRVLGNILRDEWAAIWSAAAA
jgi:hypothetical protein